MKKISQLFTAMTIAALTLSGTAAAREHERGDRMQRDGARVELRAPNGNREQRRAPSQSRRDAHTGENRSTRRVERRQANQQARIRDARRDGDLNNREVRRLRQDQRKVTRMERRFGTDDHFSLRERRRLEQVQDRASRRIAGARHDDHRYYQPRKHRYQKRDERRHDERRPWSRTRHPGRYSDWYRRSGSSIGVEIILDGLTARWQDWDEY